MTIKLTDVAKKAGVSPTTVSRVINNYGSLSQKTIDKVHQAMEELNYVPNSLARSLQGKGTQLIGLIFPSISNPFYGELVEKIEENLFNKDYKVILCDSARDTEKERSYLRMLIGNKVDGVITGSHNLGIKEYENVSLPIVSFDRYLGDTVPIVGSDNFLGGQLATQALIDAGCQNIAIFSGKNDSMSPTNRRVDGYKMAISKADLCEHTFHFPSPTSPIVKSSEIKQILEEHDFDGIFCTDDLTAILTIQQLEKLNLNVPKDVKVIGYDGTQFIQNYYPHLATVAQPIDEYANLLVELLLEKIKHPEKELKNFELPVKVIKSSTL
ncbi:LacI family DNA-binding transcriptional regulator [Vagococcus hydrophili]|uniref:LacI family transcriptional regulator n=1 Tax=Vagococcus hydrophili TaxID=2714947 RepID=A0A6G8AQT6_9ENTE|nr:LacI family DNA-binding transcriptional regulator [Vagococcus hydrophili]QIL47302.1 LacI family transcriptional regulator [Vagococcus hydrophili]